MLVLAMYIGSKNQDFESFLRTEFDLVEDGIRLVLDEYNSSLITYELEPGFQTFKDISKALFIFLNLNINYITTQLILNMMTWPRKLNWL